MTLPICAFHLPEDVYPFQQCTFAVLRRAFPGHLKKHILHFIRPGSLCSFIFQVRMIPFFPPYEGRSTVKIFHPTFSIYKFKTRYLSPIYLKKQQLKPSRFGNLVNNSNGSQRTVQSEHLFYVSLPPRDHEETSLHLLQ